MNLKKYLGNRRREKEVGDMIRKKGQSTLEYVLILVAIIAAFVAVAGRINQNVQDTLGGVSDNAARVSQKLIW